MSRHRAVRAATTPFRMAAAEIRATGQSLRAMLCVSRAGDEVVITAPTLQAADQFMREAHGEAWLLEVRNRHTLTGARVKARFTLTEPAEEHPAAEVARTPVPTTREPLPATTPLLAYPTSEETADADVPEPATIGVPAMAAVEESPEVPQKLVWTPVDQLLAEEEETAVSGVQLPPPETFGTLLGRHISVDVDRLGDDEFVTAPVLPAHLHHR